MEIREIKRIIELMKMADLTEFEIEENDLKLRICRHSGQLNLAPQVPPPASPQPILAPAFSQPVSSPVSPHGGAPAADDPNALFITSPMVGTFYRSPAPESPAFVEDGAKVKPETVVGIIEAMKVMNEIQAEVSGTIAEVLVENGEPVEYGQKLFKVKRG